MVVDAMAVEVVVVGGIRGGVGGEMIVVGEMIAEDGETREVGGTIRSGLERRGGVKLDLGRLIGCRELDWRRVMDSVECCNKC